MGFDNQLEAHNNSMAQNKSISALDIAKFVALGGVSMGLNYLITKTLKLSSKQDQLTRKPFQSEGMIQSSTSIDLKARTTKSKKESQNWGSLKLIKVDAKDGLLCELEMMAKIFCPFVKVSNLIVDMGLENVVTIQCPLVTHKLKTRKQDPFLFEESLVVPGEYIIQNCQFRSGESVESEKKFMRAGPRSTQYFKPSQVRADIVAMGRSSPGINNIIRELVILLKDVYKVPKVYGIKFSFIGYSTKNIIEMTTDLVEKIHHVGGCFLGSSATDKSENIEGVVDSLVERGVNQVYFIGGNNTFAVVQRIYKEITKRRLNIALCVCLKSINKDIAYFDTCFGFESAVEETQSFISKGYSLAKSNFNSTVLIKVPGTNSGFLAMDAVRSARNANVCLVPEFQYDLYGDKGLLNHIVKRIQVKGYCIIVISEGAVKSVRDLKPSVREAIAKAKGQSQIHAYELFLHEEIKKQMIKNNIKPFNLFFLDSTEDVRAVPANSLDTKLCCQIALCSIQGLMCGYTDFAIGHLKNRVAMVPLPQMENTQKFSLKHYDENWQRLLSNTRQPSFLNDQHQFVQ